MVCGTGFTAEWNEVQISTACSYICDAVITAGRNDGVNRIYANKQDGYVYEFTWSGSSWVKTEVGFGSSYMSRMTIGNGRNDGTKRVYSTNDDGNVYEFSWSGQEDAWTKITIGSGNAGMYGIQLGTAKNDSINRIYTANKDGHIYEFTWSGSSWTKVDISSTTNYMLNIAIGTGRNDGINRIYATNDDGHLYEFSWSGSSWTKFDVNSSITDFIDIKVNDGKNNGTKNIYATNIDEHVYEFVWSGSTWVKTDLGSCSVGGSAANIPITIGNVRNDGINRVYGGSSGINEFTWTGSAWQKVLMKQLSNVTFVTVGDARNDGFNRIYFGSIVSYCIYELSYDTNTKYQTNGYVKDVSNNVIANVAITLVSNINRSTTTDSNGYYQFADLVSTWTYSIVPEKTGYTFNPSSITIVLLNHNMENQNFIGTLVDTTSPSGMVFVPAGSFNMGQSGVYGAEPIHRVYLDAYYIDKYEVTNEQYKQFIDSGGYSNSGYWTTDGWTWKTTNNIIQPGFWIDSTFGYNAGTNLPVVGISWYEAYAYAKWAGKRLPTEAEWEKAARWTDERTYPWGADIDSTKLNYSSNIGHATVVGSYESGKSPYGCYDMAGNVWEWCNDWDSTNYYSNSPANNPQGPVSGSCRVQRGGGWYGNSNDCKSACGGAGVPDYQSKGLGIRCALNVTQLVNNSSTQTVSGYVKDSSSIAISGVTVTLVSNINRSTTTDSNGYYQFADLVSTRTYSIVPEKTGYIFTPSSITIVAISTNTSNQNFVGTISSNSIPANTRCISGFVKTSSNVPISGAIVQALFNGTTNTQYTTYTSTDGSYSLNVSSGMLYWLFVSSVGYVSDLTKGIIVSSDIIHNVLLEQGDTKLVGYYKFDEYGIDRIFDYSGYGNIGTVYGAAWVTEKTGYSLRFDGVNDYVNANGPSLNFGGNEITVESWVCASSTQNTSTIMAQRNTGSGTGNWQLYAVSLPAKTLFFNIWNSDGAQQCYSNTFLLPNVWTHIVATYDGSSIKIYKDGVSICTGSATGSILTVTTNLFIGVDGWSHYFAGKIGESAIYKKVLTSEDILGRYNSGKNRYETIVSTEKFSCGGYVKDVSSVAIANVTITLVSNINRSIATDSNGYYQFIDLVSTRTYSIVPEKNGYTFNPSSITVTGISSNMSNQNFVGTFYKSSPTVTINNIVGSSGTVQINYTTYDIDGDSVITTGWQYSLNNSTWYDIPEQDIGNNFYKSTGIAYITWNTNSTLPGVSTNSVCFRMKCMGYIDGTIASFQTNINNLPVSLYAHSSVIYNGYLYITGGSNGSSSFNTVYYAKINSDGSVGSFQTNVNNIPVSLSNHSSLVNNGYLYITGGTNNTGQSLNTVYYAKINSDGSVAPFQINANNILTPVSNHSSVIYNGYLYITGGTNEIGQSINTVYYARINSDGSVGSFHTNANIPISVCNHSSVIYNGYLYITNGWNGSNKVFQTMYYAKINSDGSIDSFQLNVSSIPYGEYWHSSVINNGYLYITGGDIMGNTLYYVYYAKINSNGSIGPLYLTKDIISNNTFAPVCAHSSVVNNGYLYITGGRIRYGSIFDTLYYTKINQGLKSDYSVSPSFAIDNPVIINNTYNICGYVKDISSVAIGNVTIALVSNINRSTATDSNGYYQFTDLVSTRTYSIVPEKTGYTFNPSSITVTGINSNMSNQNFVGITNSTNIITGTYYISGYIKTSTSVAINGVTVTCGTHTVTTDNNGFYQFHFLGISSGTYTIVPNKINYTFAPLSITLSLGTDMINQNFIGTYYEINISTLTWNIQTIDNTGDVGRNSSIGLDFNGQPHIAYYNNGNGGLKYAKWNGSSWDIQTVDLLTTVGSAPSIILDANNMPNISYIDTADYNLKYAKWNGTSWDIQTVDTAADVDRTSSIAIDKNGKPCIAYGCYNINLKYAKWNGSSWDIQTVDAGTGLNPFVSLILDSSDNPHISYSAASQHQLKYARWNGISWDIQTIPDNGIVGDRNSIALDKKGNPHISYYDETNRKLKYAKWNGASWEIQTVDSNGYTGYGTSILLDKNSFPNILHYDWGYGILKYSKWNGSFWENTIIDTQGTIGGTKTLVIDSSDNIHICYYDTVNTSLKYAKCTNSVGILKPSTSVFINIQDIISDQASQNEKNVPVLKIGLRANTGLANWSKIKLDLTGSCVDGNINLVKVWKDLDNDGEFTVADSTPGLNNNYPGLITYGTEIFTNKEIEISLKYEQFIPANTVYYFITYDIDQYAPVGKTVGLRIDTTGCFTIDTLIVTSQTFPVQTRLIGIDERLSTVKVQYKDIAKTTDVAYQGQKSVPMLQMRMKTDFGTNKWSRIRVERIGGSRDAFHPYGKNSDVKSIKIFKDSTNNDVLDLADQDITAFNTTVSSCYYINGTEYTELSSQTPAGFDIILQSTFTAEGSLPVPEGSIYPMVKVGTELMTYDVVGTHSVLNRPCIRINSRAKMGTTAVAHYLADPVSKTDMFNVLDDNSRTAEVYLTHPETLVAEPAQTYFVAYDISADAVLGNSSGLQIRESSWVKCSSPNIALFVETTNGVVPVGFPIFTSQIDILPGAKYNVSGYVRNSNNVAFSSVTVSLSGDVITSTITDANGYYQFTDLLAGTYVIRPIIQDHVCNPPNITITSLNQDLSNQNFTGIYSTATYYINGYIKTSQSVAVRNVVVNLTGSVTLSTTTDINGFYQFSGLPEFGGYTVTPAKTDYTFNPVNKTFNLLATSFNNQNFVAVLYDVTAPQSPNIVSTTHPDHNTEYANANARFTFSVPGGDDSGIDGYYYLVNGNPATLVGADNGTYVTWNNITLLNQSDGIWYLHVVAKDGAGNYSSVSTAHYKFIIHLMFDPSTDAVFNYSDGTKINIPAGTVRSATKVEINKPNMVDVPKVVNSPKLKETNVVVEIKLADGTHSLDKAVMLTIPFTPTDIQGLNRNKLRLFYWDETKLVWVMIPNSGVDPVNNVVTASVNHLTLFRNMEYSAAGEYIEDLCNYPNPFKSMTENTRIRYVLKQDSVVKIKIFDLIGDLVWENTIPAGVSGNSVAGPNEVAWDGKNGSGEKVDVGAYICIVECEGVKLKTKIGVK
jgi:formylglycine-generating enzyme required for sulfatase activity